MGFAGTELLTFYMFRACKVESMGEGEAVMQGIPVTFRSVGQNSASSAWFSPESNSYADSKVQETGFVFQTSSYSSISETLSR